MIVKAEERILILAPRGRDAEVMQQVLSRGNSACHLCLDLGDLRSQLEAEVGAVLVTEEALVGEGLEQCSNGVRRSRPGLICPSSYW
jgi:hypothetical protein